MLRLILNSPVFSGGRIELLPTQLPVVLGRSRKCDIPISDSLLSRRHCEIHLTDSGVAEIQDLGSTNLTIVNEHDIDSHILADGDRILLGETEILVEVIMADDDPNERTTRDLTMLPGPGDDTIS
ncbi:MAG: FHA domain-containing protein [Planctomycetaceae bacterium]